MSFWCYLLRCTDGSYYAGHTDNLEQRIGQHRQGGIDGYTAKRLPVDLVWSQDFASREEALAAEQQIKGWSRKKKEAMIRGEWKEVARLAKKDFSRGRGSRNECGSIRRFAPTHHERIFSVRPE